MNIADLRREYTSGGLFEEDAGDDPIDLFKRWFDQAVELELPDANAMTLATVSALGVPSVRVVLLKGVDRGFTFFTNYKSRKGDELSANIHAALCFFWYVLERQIRIEGVVERIASEESDEYFESRPLGSKLGAWVSEQSEVIADRGVLESQLATLSEKYANGNVPRPPHWGGYRLIPQAIEFWHGRPNRLHDRLRYTMSDRTWRRERLAP